MTSRHIPVRSWARSPRCAKASSTRSITPLDQADWQKKPQGRKRPEFDPSLEALQPAAEGKQLVLFEPGSALMVDRAARVARELKLDFALVSCGQEWRRPDLAKETGATFIVPVNFPNLPQAAE